MKIVKLCNTIALVILLSLFAMAQASERYQKDIFSISLPNGWVEMPQEVLDAYEQQIAKMVPNVPAQNYDYGFQLDSAENWFEYPYMLVQIKNMGRISERQIEELQGYSVQENFDEHQKDLSPIMSEIQAGKMYYDKAANIIWLRIESNVADIGLMSGLSGMIPTEKGFIQVSGYSLKDDFSTYESVFKAAVMSVTPSSELVYKPKWSDSLPPAVGGIDWSQVFGMAIAGALIGAVIAFIAGFLRKKKR